MPARAAPLALPFDAPAAGDLRAARAKLEEVFGYKTFRPHQEASGPRMRPVERRRQETRIVGNGPGDYTVGG